MSPSFTTTAIVVAVTCTAGGARAQGATQERDSAGVRIITQRAAPVVSIDATHARFSLDGTESGREPFHRINGVVALHDGIVVANAGTYELRFYGRDGSPRVTVGRLGSGPGEFRIITWIQPLPGDSVLVYDGPNRRMSVWTSTGEHVRDIPVALGRMRVEPGAFTFPPSPLGMFSEREFFHIGGVSIGAAPGMQRAMGYLVRSNLATQKGDTIAHIAVMDMQIVKENRGSPMRHIAFPRMVRYALGSGELAISDCIRFAVSGLSHAVV